MGTDFFLRAKNEKLMVLQVVRKYIKNMTIYIFSHYYSRKKSGTNIQITDK